MGGHGRRKFIDVLELKGPGGGPKDDFLEGDINFTGKAGTPKETMDALVQPSPTCAIQNLDTPFFSPHKI